MPETFSELKFTDNFYNDKTFSAESLTSSIDNFSNYLKLNCPCDSPFIYLFANNHPKTIIAYFSIIKAGYIAAIVDPGLKENELEDLKQLAPPTALVKPDCETDSFDYRAPA